MHNTLLQVEAGTAPRTHQQEEEATYASILKKSTGLINWNQSALQIQNFIRGLSPWPSAYTYYKNNMMKIWDVKITNKINENKNVPGQIINITEQEVEVQTGNGTLILKKFNYKENVE